jgi:NAD(P)-dependent dehydrogenase (short-subunit alcohol dehydrogenase family)
MQIELAGATVALDGEANAVTDAMLAALHASGGRVVGEIGSVDILVVSCPLRPGAAARDPRALHANACAVAAAMAGRGGGRIVFVTSAVAGMPMRRHPGFSIDNAAILAGMRTLAMEFGPKVLVNAVGLGMIEGASIVAGDSAMLSHTPVGRAGTIEEAVAVLLFFCDPLNTYTTGQMLAVDGGWMAGYGRNF